MTQAVLLAAGESSRFWPLSEGKHKSLNKIMGKSLIQHTIENIKSAGIEEVIVIQGSGREIEKNIEDCGVKFVVQEEPKGMGNALSKAKKFIKERFFVLTPNHPDASDFFKPMLDISNETGSGVVLWGKETNTPWLYGILKIKGGIATGIVEKPERGKEPSKIKVVSNYLLSPDFFDYLDRVPESHYNYEDALDLYMKEKKVPVIVREMETISMKYPWHLLDASKKILKNIKPYISDSANIDPTAKINGKVHIEDGVKIFANATITGPCYIGKNCVIGNNSLVRDYTNLEEGSVVGMGAEVTRSIMQKNVHLHSGFFGDSVIGEDCRIGAGTITANVRIDREPVRTTVKGEKINTFRKSMGIIMGENTRAGICTKFMPGVMVGSNCIIGPNTVVRKNIKSDTVFYTEFKDVVKKR